MNRCHPPQNPLLHRWLRFSLLFLCCFSPLTLAGDLAGGGTHSLAIGTGQSAGYAWGVNRDGQVGNPASRELQRYPFLWWPYLSEPTGAIATPLSATPAPLQVASGDRHSIALRNDGTVWTWGHNGHGQLGDGTTTDRNTPVPVAGFSEVIAVAAGKVHSLAVTRDGRVWAWGNNDYRQLGNNSSEGSRTPVQVVTHIPATATQPDQFPPLTGVIAVAASEVHSVALKGDGTVWAWGNNQYGQLGTGNTYDAATAKPVVGLTGVKAIVAGGHASTTVEVGTAYTLAQDAEGAVWGWGNNAKCQLGEAAWEQQTRPVSLPNLRNLGDLQVLTGGEAHGTALTVDGQVWTWGDNQHGQQGDGTSNRVCAPQRVATLDEVETLGAGPAHTLATKRDGTVWGWGYNLDGQLGNGTIEMNGLPTPVKGLCGVGQLNVKQPPPTGCPLTLNTAGDGRGTVSGAGEYAAGTSILLTATPDAGSRFDGWQPEACTATPLMMPTPARALTCTATFSRVATVTYSLRLDTTGDGGGTVTGSGNYAAGATVTLTAEPDVQSAFAGWTPHPCAARFLMPAGALTCLAAFEPLPNVPLTVVAPQGGGTVSGGGQYQVGETVTLNATPQSGAQLAGWSPPPCAAVFTMPNEPLTCTATFTTGSGPAVVALIGGYYQAILGRGPEAAEPAQWEGDVARMDALDVDRAEVFRLMTGQLFTGAEYRGKNPSDAQYVTDLHQTFWRRPPTAAELTAWTEQITAGLSREVVLYHFLFSAEFTAYLESQLGAATSRPEVLTIVDFYRGLLNRLPDDGGFRYWLERFQTAQCQGAAALTAEVEAISSQFAHSPEYLYRQRPNREYLQDLYNVFLRRGADVEGFNYWLNRLETGDLTREQARQFFVAAPEFQGRVNQIIQQGCNRIPFTQVSAGGSHTCGVKSDGAVACWGWNGYGQAERPAGTFTQVSAGDYHTCGVKTDRAVACWGSNTDWGGNFIGQATPPAGTFTQVSAGRDHTCGVKTDGAVACWGDDYGGRATPPAGAFTQVSADFAHTCGVKTDGAVACWGENDEGQANRPAGTFTQVSAGSRHTCGVKTDETVVCWGRDDEGQSTPP